MPFERVMIINKLFVFLLLFTASTKATVSCTGRLRQNKKAYNKRTIMNGQ